MVFLKGFFPTTKVMGLVALVFSLWEGGPLHASASCEGSYVFVSRPAVSDGELGSSWSNLSGISGGSFHPIDLGQANAVASSVSPSTLSETSELLSEEQRALSAQVKNRRGKTTKNIFKKAPALRTRRQEILKLTSLLSSQLLVFQQALNDLKKSNPPPPVVAVDEVQVNPCVSLKGAQLFTSSAKFSPPPGVHVVTVVLIGGGAAGGQGGTWQRGGGGAGYAVKQQLDLDQRDSTELNVVIGQGGSPDDVIANSSLYGNQTRKQSSDGGSSEFAGLHAAGGKSTRIGSSGQMILGGWGGSGGGAGAGSSEKLRGGIGGSCGENGGDAQTPQESGWCAYHQEWKGGSGSGRQNMNFAMRALSCGEGGQGGFSPLHGHAAGGGAGGILVDNQGPWAEKGGGSAGGGEGGRGYGAGGGGGGYSPIMGVNPYMLGGRGADGMVYIYWD